MEYQHDFSSLHESMFDVDVRQRKAQTALCVLRDVLGEKLKLARLLNVGSSSGIMDSVFATELREVVGIDIDEGAVEHARQNFQRDNLRFELGDGLNIPFPDESFDVLICSQVYEHVPDQARLIAELERVLVPGGVCYFAATNRFILMEPHYRLPFLSWLPASFADAYVRVTGKGTRYFERMRSYPALRRLVSRFDVVDYTATVLDDPRAYAFDYLVKPGSAMYHVSRFIARHVTWICPGYLWILKKK
jgi:2-polyprenyl-3-methyl-5-hydroxy-6-metoxy-1,4-benzoquinol methylase